MSDNRAQSHAVYSAERMLAHESEVSPIVRKVFEPFYIEFDVEELEAVVEEVDTRVVSLLHQENIKFVLVKNTL